MGGGATHSAARSAGLPGGRPFQLAPFRRTQVAHDKCHTAISFESMLVAGNAEMRRVESSIRRGAQPMTMVIELSSARPSFYPIP
ncbi:hypothetical protein ACVWWN_000869 [Mycobacterium sp. URHB0021]